ncbi:Imm1 family immunity protein [Streptomyces sp. AP-93]|uniref:Imm1 family immunity protein n=1 Tax=Streptomyces sp. AP-93 TaxID=2929048 RepID=UPI0024349148|nr:Imm1 family immunity protein [Streptomyces sp. AP-93]MCJ0875840.1 Imm1 family immunity protein [Streptomyces sp. AP-93]
MIVLGATHKGSFYARTDDEVGALIEHIMNDLPQGSTTPDGFAIMPEKAVVSIVEGEYPEETSVRWPRNYLYVTVNTQNGYGALKWWTPDSPEGSDENHVSQFIWTSGNPNPPSFDPHLISDSGTPSYYPPEAAIPLEWVRQALEEFCRTRTGDRPESVSWILLEQTV